MNSDSNEELRELREKNDSNKAAMVAKNDLLCEKQNKVDQLQADLIRLQNSTNVNIHNYHVHNFWTTLLV